MLSHFKCVLLFATIWAIARQASLVRGILQGRIVVWVATSFSRGSSQPRDWTHVSYVSCIAGGFFTTRATWEVSLLLFSRPQSPSYVRLFVTPWTAARQASLSLTISRSLPKFMSIALVMPSSPLILWCPLLLLPSIFPNIPISLTHLILQQLWEAGAIEGQPCKTTVFKCQVKEERKRRHRVKKRRAYPGSQVGEKERDKLCYWEMNQEKGEVSSFFFFFFTFLAVLGCHCSTWAFSGCHESGAVL